MSNNIVIGITWTDAKLVVFDPVAGTVFPTPVQLPTAHGDFRGLTFDTQHNKLYALTQGWHWLYSINPASGHVTDQGQLNITGADIGGLAYQPSTDALFTTTTAAGMTPTSQIVQINVATRQVTPVAPPAQRVRGQPGVGCGRPELPGLHRGAGRRIEHSVAHVHVPLRPGEPASVHVVQLAVSHGAGLAPSKNAGRYYSWVNAATHFYIEVDPATGNFVQLANSDAVNVISDAMTTVNIKRLHVEWTARAAKHRG